MNQKTILVVDDDPVVRTLTVECLSMLGYTTLVAENGTECINLLELGNKPDLIFLDMMMPDMSGVEVLTSIRESQKYNKIPIVLLSATMDTEALMSDNKVSATAYLQKPYKLNDLKQTLSKILESN